MCISHTIPHTSFLVYKPRIRTIPLRANNRKDSARPAQAQVKQKYNCDDYVLIAIVPTLYVM